MRVRGPNDVGRAVQTDPTLLRYASAITEQKKCWELLFAQQHATTSNNMQQGVQITQHETSNNVASVCTQPHLSFLLSNLPRSSITRWLTLRVYHFTVYRQKSRSSTCAHYLVHPAALVLQSKFFLYQSVGQGVQVR